MLQARRNNLVGSPSCGCAQGDSLSSKLFCYATDAVLFRIRDVLQIPCGAYADDGLLRASNDVLQKYRTCEAIVEKVSAEYASVGLKVNNIKCHDSNNVEHKIEFLNVTIQRTFEQKHTIAWRLY